MGFSHAQGSYGSWKTWKVLEFYCGIIFPGLESPGKRLLVLESSGNLFNSSKRYVRRVKYWDLGSERVNGNFRILEKV